MELKEAQDLIGMVVENPAATIQTETLARAIATVLVRNGLLGAKPRMVALTVFAAEEG